MTTFWYKEDNRRFKSNEEIVRPACQPTAPDVDHINPPDFNV